MKKVSFRQFNSIVSTDEDLSADQITEIFGMFQGGKDKAEELKKKREELKLAAEKKRKELQAARDAKWKSAKDNVENPASRTHGQVHPSQLRNHLANQSTSDMRAGAARSVDRFAVEAVMSDIHQDLADIMPELKSGKVSVKDIMSGETDVSEQTVKFVKQKFSKIAKEEDFDSAEDFEKICGLVKAEIEEELA